jgi:hypothetical protein
LLSCLGVTAGLRALALSRNIQIPMWELSHQDDSHPPAVAPADTLPSEPEPRQRQGHL